MAVTTREQFLEVLSGSKLLTAAQFDVVARSELGADDPRSLARYIVQEGWLTRWQAQQLLAGRTKFFLGKYKLLESLGRDAALSVPTPDHYLPLLYVLAARRPDDEVSFPVEGVDGGSVSMLSVRLG